MSGDALLGVYERDLTVVSGRGAKLFAADGRCYLDFACGVGVNGLGYGDKAVIKAIREQAGKIVHVSNLYHSLPGAELADKLASLAFPSKVFLCNSGTEAVEAALKFARRVGGPGRTEFVAFERGFHGRTMGALSITWNAKYREPFGPLIPGVRFCPWNDLAAAAEAITERTAAVVIETVQGEGGVRPAPVAFLQGLKKLCEERGALFVAEEVQCGLGRTGKLFAYEHAGLAPDLLTLAKPLGGGLPLGAVLIREELAAALHPGDHGSTFGGNPVAAAASLAVLARLTAPGFLDNVTRRGEQLFRGLRALKKKHPQIVDVRGLGLMAGVQFAGGSGDVVKGLRQRDVLATKAGDDVLRLLPPLVVKPGEIKTALEALGAVLEGGAGVAGA